MAFLIVGGICAFMPTIPHCCKTQDALTIPITNLFWATDVLRFCLRDFTAIGQAIVVPLKITVIASASRILRRFRITNGNAAILPREQDSKRPLQAGTAGLLFV